MPHTLDPFEHDLDCPSSLVLVHVRLDDGDDRLDLDLLSEMHALGLAVLADVIQYRSIRVRWNVALDDVQDLAGEVEADEHPVPGPHLPQAVGQPLVLLRRLAPHPVVLGPHNVTQERDRHSRERAISKKIRV